MLLFQMNNCNFRLKCIKYRINRITVLCSGGSERREMLNEPTNISALGRDKNNTQHPFAGQSSHCLGDPPLTYLNPAPHPALSPVGGLTLNHAIKDKLSKLKGLRWDSKRGKHYCQRACLHVFLLMWHAGGGVESLRRPGATRESLNLTTGGSLSPQ